MSSLSTGARHFEHRRTLVNFGGNRTWQPRCYRPRDESEVLQILARHRSERIRAVGSLHSWSDVVVVPDVALDMSRFDDVQPFTRGGATFVRVGAGCTLRDLLDRLHSATDRTLPTLGVIKRQTVAGLISTATHGSGRQSVSHFVTAVRVAAYDASGNPTVFEHRGGDELRAARCALGCMGVILSIELVTVAKYRIRETVRRLDRIEAALRLYRDHPLTQFALVPYDWKFIAWERHMMPPGGHGGGRLKARLFRAFNLVGVDVVSHLLLKVCLVAGSSAVKTLLKRLPRLLIANVARVDDAEHVLTLRHDLFRHEEMEMFVPESRVTEAAQLLRLGIEVFAGDTTSVPAEVERKLRAAGLYDELMQSRGSYVHHYPMLFRRVLPEDTLISMASSSREAWFSFSLFTFDKPGKRKAFYEFCSWFARAMHTLLGARLHWGKHYPLGAAETARMYPELERFKQICRTNDPTGVFRNDFTDRVLERT
jgi:FAD/FMN-containing dehydrogenase